MNNYSIKELEKIRLIDEIDEQTGKKYRQAPNRFAKLLNSRDELINLLRGKAKVMQMKIIFDIWDMDIGLEKWIDWYVERSASRYKQLPDIMANWKPFGGTNRFELYIENVCDSSFRRADDKKGIVDKIIRRYSLDIADLTGRKYPTWEEAVDEILSHYKPTVERQSIENYLDQDEHDNLELKGSLSIDIDHYCSNNKEIVLKKSLIDEGVMKSIVAFLNTRGGVLIIGVLDDFNKYKDLIVDKPIYNKKIIFGIKEEYPKKNWDGYLQKITELIEIKIGGNVFDSSLVSIEKVVFADKDLCVLTVQPSDIKQYLYDDFYIRRNNKSIQLKGREIDIYWEQRKY